MPTPIVHPGLRIASRGGQLVAWTPERDQPIALTVADLEFLDGLIADRPSTPADESRYGPLRSAGVLVEAGEVSRSSPAGRIVDLPALDAAPKDMPARLRLPKHVCLELSAFAWAAWSAVLGAYCRLTSASARMMLLAGDGRDRSVLTSQPVVAAHDPPAAHLLAARLLAVGLLMEASDTHDWPSPGREAASVSLRASDPWAGLMPDGRRPIYFVTHHVDHLPLALGMLRAGILAHEGGALLAHYQPLPIVSMSVAEIQALYQRFGPGVWLFSNYVWSEQFNKQLSSLVKSVDHRNITVHGGPSAPKYEEACRRFMEARRDVDIVVRGEGELTLVHLLATLAGPSGRAGLRDVPGLTYFADAQARRGLVRTPDRARQTDLAQLPSPYLSGMFDNYGGEVVAAILETNRGCPYSCTFCDWGSATQEKIHRFDLERVKAEIDWIGRHRIRVLWIADANFGIFARDVEIAQNIAAAKAIHGFPREVVVNYPKNATQRIADIVKIFVQAGICGQGIVSIQTTDAATLRVIRRDNISSNRYDELAEVFRREGLPLSTDLMIGLPGATVRSFKADLQYYFDDDVGVKAYRTELLPNSPMADPVYMRDHAVRVDARQFLVSTASYTETDLAEMLAIWSAFDMADGYAVLRYVLRYLQWDHGVVATEFVHALVQQVRNEPARYPGLAWLLRHFHRERLALGGWGPLYAEVGHFAGQEFGVVMDTGFATALQVNELLMPRAGRRFPETHRLQHDFVCYFERNRRAGVAARSRLTEEPPGQLVITDPERASELDFRTVEQYDNHQVFFDLPAAIARRRSAPNFVRKAA